SGLVQTVVLCKFSVEPLDSFEILALVGVIERFAEKEVVLIVLIVPTQGGTGAKSQDKAVSDYAASRTHRLQFPKRDPRAAGVRSGHRQFYQLRLHFLAEGEVLRAAEVRAALKLAVDKHVELVIPSGHIADVDPLHATLAQCLELFGAIDVVRNQLTVDLEPHGIEAQLLVTFGQRNEDRDLCP